MFQKVFSSPTWHLSEEYLHDVVLLRRTPLAFELLRDAEESYDEVARALEKRPVHRKMLVDLRATPGRNDPRFEKVIAPHRQRILAWATRAAVVVQSATGRMQVSRHVREDEERGGPRERTGVVVVQSLAEALDHLELPANLLT